METEIFQHTLTYFDNIRNYDTRPRKESWRCSQQNIYVQCGESHHKQHQATPGVVSGDVHLRDGLEGRPSTLPEGSWLWSKFI